MALIVVGGLLGIVGFLGVNRWDAFPILFALGVTGSVMALAVWRRIMRRSQYQLGRREKWIVTGITVAVIMAVSLYIFWPLYFPR